MGILKIVLYGIYHLSTAIASMLLGRRQASYATQVDIAAPRDLVWGLLRARRLEFHGLFPHQIDSFPRGDGSSIVDCRVRIGASEAPFAYRIVDERHGEALLTAIVEEATAPEFVMARDHYVAALLTDVPKGTRLTIIDEVNHSAPAGYFWVPMSSLINALKIKRLAEGMLQRAEQPDYGALQAAAVTGLVTFASFMQLYGWQSAAILVFLILIHEVGHVVAMRWLGLPVQGIYFIPFFGGVAVGGAERTPGESGLVSLMGPGLSLVTTAMFFFAWRLSGEPLMHKLAVMSAFLNGLNLLPVLPLDGGRVAEALLSRLGAGAVQHVKMGMLLVGCAVAFHLHWHALAVLAMLQVPSILPIGGEEPAPARTMPIALDEMGLLGVAYGASLAFYAAVLLAP